MLSLLAHAAPISYRFPLPIWLYAVAGGAAVLASAAALGARAEPREQRSRDLYRYVRPLHRAFLLASAVWWAQVVLIVSGHVVAVFAAHRAALKRHVAPVQALALQGPLVLLMVAYTVAGLWVLALQIKAGG